MMTAGERLALMLRCPQCGYLLGVIACGPEHAVLQADPTRHPLVIDALAEALRERETRIEGLIEASSLGTPEAVAARESVPQELGRALALVSAHVERRDYRGDSLGCSCGARLYRGHFARVIADALSKAGQNRSHVTLDPEDHDRVAKLNIRFHRGKSRSDVENMQAALREFLTDDEQPESDDLPECSCAMTEGSMRTCPRHGEEPWVEHVLSEYGTTTCPVEAVRAEVDDGRCSACGGLVTPPAQAPSGGAS